MFVLDDVADFASTAGQILHVLRGSSKPMNSNEIYNAGSFDYEHTCYNGLAQLSKKGVLHRERVNGLYHYVVAPGADLSDWEDELKELGETGLPAPDPQRRVGLSREEYTTLSKEEKKTLRRTRSVFHRETEIREVEEQVEKPALEIPQFLSSTVPSHAPLPAVQAPPPLALPAPVTEQPRAPLLQQALEKRAAIDREIAMIRLLADIAGGGNELAFMLQDYDELLELSISCMDDADAKPLVENQLKARAFVKLLKEADTSPFKRAAHQLLKWAFICQDSAGDDESGRESIADAEECRRLAELFGTDPNTDPWKKPE